MDNEQTVELFGIENRKIQRFWPDWRIESQLGKGAFGAVYKAVRRDYNLVSYSAIKIISIPQESEYEQLKIEFNDDQALEKYLDSVADSCVKEIELMNSVQGTENIVNIHDYKRIPKADSVGWEIYIRMELLIPFNEYARDHEHDENEIRQVGIDICKALEKCEKQNIIHRDIKPENIFRSIDGVYKLGDFGIAKNMNSMATASLSHKGTESYMAPEVFSASTYDSRVDIYSLGMVLYRLLNDNCPPFLTPETRTNPMQRESALRKRVHGERLPAPKNASTEMTKIILKACECDPQKRYSTASEMRKALESMQVGAAVPVRNVNWKLLICILLGLAAAVLIGIFSPKFIGGKANGGEGTSSNVEDTFSPDSGTSPDVNASLTVPYVIGATEEDALKVFKQNGLSDPVVERVNDSSVEAGKIISQSINAYEQVDKETVITLVVSMGPAKFKMPSVENKDYAEAKQILEAQGLIVVPHFQKDDSVAENIVISQNIDPDTEVKAGDTVELVVSSGKTLVTVKNVVGKTSDAAKTELEGQGFKVNVVEAFSDSVAKGKVISQNPYADSDQPNGATITITVSRGVETVSVPNVCKLTEAKAKSTLTTAGFKVKVTYKNDSSVANGSVISQEPKADSKVAKGSEITIVVSSGKKLVTVPDLYNKTEQEAKSTLEKLGLKVTVVTDYSNDVDEGRVCAQSVSGKQVEEGSTVTITISKGANTVTVSFDSNGGSYCASINVIIGGKYGTLPSPTRQGYIFEGWYTSVPGGAKITSSSTVSNFDDHILYAHWIEDIISVTGVSLNMNTVNLEVGDTFTLTANVSPSAATDKSVTWSSSDSTVATVANGVVTAKKTGSATITVMTVDGNKTASCYVTVESKVGDKPTIAIECSSIDSDGLFTADVVVYNNPGICGFQFEVNFNNSHIQVVGVDRDEDYVTVSSFPEKPTLNIDKPGVDLSALSYVSANSARSTASYANGVYLSIIFKVVRNFNTTTLTIDNELFVSQDKSAVSFDTVDATISNSSSYSLSNTFDIAVAEIYDINVSSETFVNSNRTNYSCISVINKHYSIEKRLLTNCKRYVSSYQSNILNRIRIAQKIYLMHRIPCKKYAQSV